MAHRRPHSGRLTDPLTEREQEILACLAEGVTNQEIANRLHLAEKTVRWYNSRIYSKLGVHNRAEAVAQAKALSLLAGPDAGLVAGTHNLPPQATRFIGRRRELVELAALLADSHTRLVTILAPGGMGKTRLALEAARAQIGRFADGVYFVPLAPLSSAEYIVTTIAERVGLQFHDMAPSQAKLLGFFSRKQMLLVLDSFEHLLDGALLVTEVLRAAPQVKVLVTSREKLNLSSETVFTLAGLSFPDWETPEDALEYDAVILLLQSAHRVRPDFALRPNDLTYLARICQLTAGMPLALVLAAGWVDILTLEQIAGEIQQGIDILETEMRDVPDRQRSVRSTFDYTWSHLDDTERDVFMKLSVFRGGFTAEAAQAVVGANMRHLRKLIDKSLVQVLPTGRYDLHELLRKYGEEKLVDRDMLDTMRETHSTHYTDFLARREDDLKGRRQSAALDEIDADFANISMAWNWAVVHMNHEPIYHAALSLMLFLDMCGRIQEVITLFRRAQDRFAPLPGEEPSPVWIRLTTCSQLDEAAIERALVTARRCSDQEMVAHCLASLGFLSYQTRGCIDGMAVLEESLTIFRELDDRFFVARGYNLLSLCHIASTGQIDTALELAQQGLELFCEIGNRVEEAISLSIIGIALFHMGNFAEAEIYFREGLDIRREMNDLPGISVAATQLGSLVFVRGDFDEAKLLAQEALQIATDIHHLEFKNFALALLGRLACIDENYAEAMLLCIPHSPHMFAKAGMALAACGLMDYPTAKQHTRHMLAYHSPALIMTWNLPVIAVILAHESERERAVELLALAFTHPQSASGWMEKWPLLTRLRANLEHDLGAATYTAAWVRGTRLDLETVVRDLLAEYRE